MAWMQGGNSLLLFLQKIHPDCICVCIPLRVYPCVPLYVYVHLFVYMHVVAPRSDCRRQYVSAAGCASVCAHTCVHVYISTAFVDASAWTCACMGM